jgi:hypothetical protein
MNTLKKQSGEMTADFVKKIKETGVGIALYSKAVWNKVDKTISINNNRGIFVLTPLKTERLDNGKGTRKLLSDIVVAVSTPDFDGIIVVPKGFETDFSSLPWFVRGSVNWVKVDMAGVIHDWLYTKGCPINIKRIVKDEIWMLASYTGSPSVSKYVAKIMYYGLRAGGEARDENKYVPKL